jgi:hypothetical protein
MAEIPLSLVQSRVPRGGQYSPAQAVGLPRMAPPPGGIAEAIGYAGRQVTSSLAGILEVQQRERAASETVTVKDFTARATDDLLDWQQNFAVDQSIPPLELRDRLEAKRDELAKSYADQLPARLRPKFLAEFRSAAIQPVYALDQVGVKRLGEQAQATFDHRSDQILRQTVQATSDVDRQRLQDEHDVLINDYAFQGLIAPAQVPGLKQKHRDQVAKAQWDTRIQLDPKGAITQLELGPAANPELSPEEYPKTLEKARSLHQQQLHWYDASQRRADQAVQKAQEQNTGSLWAEFVRLDPTPESSEKYRGLLAQAEQAFKDGKISPQQYQELTGRGRVMLDRSLQPGADKDNVALERDLVVELARANTPEAIEAVQARLLARANELRPETIQRLNTALDQRRNANHYSNTQEYRDGVNIILRAGVVPEASASQQRMMEEETKRKLQLALASFDEQMSLLAGKDVAAMKAQSRALAYSLRDTYFPIDEQPDLEQLGVPKAIRDARDEGELAKEIQKLQDAGVPEKQLEQFRKLWRQQQAGPLKKSTPAPAQPPAGGATPLRKGRP